ncbi:hypothetical protein M0R45_026804 [Rubus argutus]|uniref:Reverse transcriptase zinc-binding domain-containing protein n=1 Tax=Rubus argutus TaxID=59490 RepID=A0AAW1X222_RUBAR
MGFRSIAPFNLSLLAKQGWQLINQPESLAAQVFKARYHPNSSFLEANPLPDMSYAWRSILAGRQILSKGIRFQIGNGKNVSLWNDPWLPLPHNFKPFSSPMEGTDSWMVGDIVDHQTHEWIQNGMYTVKSGYHAARLTENLENQVSSSSGSCSSSKSLWNKIWRACIPPKVRVFIWRLLRGALPTRVALNKKFSIPEIQCAFCNAHAETDIHVFK